MFVLEHTKICLFGNTQRCVPFVFSHKEMLADMHAQMSSIIHRWDELEILNAQLDHQNQLLQQQVELLRQHVIHAQAPEAPSPSPRADQEIRGVGPGGCWGSRHAPHYLPW